MQKLTYTNTRGQKIVLQNSAPFILSKLEGTGGVETTLQTTKAPGQDGSTLHGVSLENRVINIEGYIFGIIREDMYKKRMQLAGILNPKLGAGTLTYQNDHSTKVISAIAEESPIFSDRYSNYQKFSLTLICPQPLWLEEKESKEEIAYWIGNLEFDLEIPEDGMELSYRESNIISNIYNRGDTECGMRIEFTAMASVENPLLLNINTLEYIKVKQTLIAGDKLIINTAFGNKRVELTRSGVTTNVFNYIDLDSTFLQLAPGDNILKYDAETGIDNLDVTIYYRPQYVGV